MNPKRLLSSLTFKRTRIKKIVTVNYTYYTNSGVYRSPIKKG